MAFPKTWYVFAFSTSVSSLLPLFVLLLGPSFASTSHEYYSLVNPYSNLVIDVKNNWLALANYTKSDTQLWRLEPGKKGLYYVINKHEGRVVDYDTTTGVSRRSRLPVTNKARVDPDNGCPIDNVDVEGRITNIGYCQQWYVQYGGILVNACDNFAVSVLDEEYIPGTYLRTSEVDGGKHQKFNLI